MDEIWIEVCGHYMGVTKDNKDNQTFIICQELGL